MYRWGWRWAPLGATIATLLTITAITAIAAVAAPVAGATQWSLVRVRAPRRAVQGQPHDGDLTAVACPANGECIAVGSYWSGEEDTSEAPLAERFNGSSWTELTTPSPGDLLPANNSTGQAPSVSFSGLSCPTAGWCMAVGADADRAADYVPFAEMWNGRTWSLVAIPVPPGVGDYGEISAPSGQYDPFRGSALTGVSCTSATSCLAVGSETGSSAVIGFAESWNGQAWSLVSFPASLQAPAAVSCTGATCMAVGAGASAEQWNGSSWTSLTVPLDSGDTLDAVSCPSADRCTAVGLTGDGSQTVAVAWDGSTWEPVAVAVPSGESGEGLDAITCGTQMSCLAAGTTTSGVAADTLTTSGFVSEATPAIPTVDLVQIQGVACMPVGACVEVGGVNATATPNPRPLAEVRTGTTWSVNAPTLAGAPGAIAGTGFSAVSCATASSCMAVGQDGGPLAEQLSHGRWRSVSLPAVTGARQQPLTGVACPAAGVCEAIGSSLGLLGSEPLAERYSGGRFVLQPSLPMGADTAYNGISCPSTSSCLAVGTDGSLLAAVLRGGRWSPTSVPDAAAMPPNTFPVPGQGSESNDLTAVSCVHGLHCVTVGDDEFNGGPSTNGPVDEWVADAFGDGAWRTLNPSQAASIVNVACGTPRACMATTENPVTLDGNVVERWNGSRWTLLTVANSGNLHLGGVACPAAGTCFLAGTENGLVSIWRWQAGTGFSHEPTPSPRGAVFVSVNAISCPSASTCEAVGTYAIKGGARYPLVIRESVAGRSRWDWVAKGDEFDGLGLGRS